MRAYCVECTMKIATKRCRQCKDKFCTDCFTLMHRTGNRKKHSYENVRPDKRLFDDAKTATKSSAAVQSSSYTGQKSDTQEKNRKPKAVNSKKDWEEFYDEQAKAKYWFNSKTGEASWIQPY